MSSGLLNCEFRLTRLAPGTMPAPKPPSPLSHMIDGYGDRLRAAREALGYAKQKDFADACNISAQRLNQWENNKYPPDIFFLAFCQQTWGLSADWILCGEIGGLPRKFLKKLVSLGATNKAPEPARELRMLFPDLPDPDPLPMPHGLHEPAAPPLRRFVRFFEFQLH